MKFPEGVTDKKAYLKYKKLEKHPIINEDQKFEASDGLEVNLAWFPHHLRKKIEHLPTEEQEEILEKKETFHSINNNATVQKRLAFGLKQGRPGINKKAKSLLDLRGAEIIDYFGRMYTTKEVLKIINEDWGIRYDSLKRLEEFRAKHTKTINEKIEKYRMSHHDIRLSTKRSRLEELTDLFREQKDKYKKTTSDSSLKLVLNIIEQIRKESEGDRLTIEGKVDVNYEVNIQRHLREEVFSTMNIKEIILGRVSARMGVNPIKLIHSLNQSFYAKFSNVLGDYDSDEASEEMVYPSQMNYDFERIGKRQAAIDRNVEEAVVEDEEETKINRDDDRAKSIKEIMLAKLKDKKTKLKSTQGDDKLKPLK